MIIDIIFLILYIIIIKYSIMNPQTYPQLVDYTKHPKPNSQGTILSQALAHIPGIFPQKPSLLQSNIRNIPHYLMNETIQKEIYNYNKKQIYALFEYICDIVIRTYEQVKRSNQTNKFEQEVLVNQICGRLAKQIPQGNLYSTNLYNSVKRQKINVTPETEIEFLKAIMISLAQTHNEEYSVQNKKWIDMQSSQKFQVQSLNQKANISEKYKEIIEQKLNIPLKPKNNYFEQLLLPAIMSQRTQKTEGEMEAQDNANFLNLLLKSQYMNQTKSPNQNYKKPEQNVSYQQQLQGYRQNQNLMDKMKQFQFENWFTNSLSQMTYYQSYMMAHMADLIFLHPQKFNIKLIKYSPYIEQLHKQVMNELNNLKSEETALRTLFNSKLKEVPFQIQSQPVQNRQECGSHNSNPTLNAKTQPTQAEFKQKIKQKNILDRALNKVRNYYEKTKQQLENKHKVKPNPQNIQNPSPKNQQLQQQPVLYQQNSITQQYQNFIVPISLTITDIFYRSTIMDLENFNFFIQGLNPKYNPRANLHMHENLLEKALHYVQNTPDRQSLQLQNKYYHEIQSQMAIVMFLYKALALNFQNNYNYTPFKRKQIIRICKKIFIQEKKKDKKLLFDKNRKVKQIKQELTEIAFRNWPVVLKYLENNRKQVITSAISTTIEKQAQQIIESFYSTIKHRKMEGSTIGKLFDGIEHVSQNIPSIKLVCLSSGSNPSQNLNKQKTTTQCKVVHILISGFLSEDTDKLEEWADMIQQMPDSEIYALVWESTTIKGLVKFFLKTAADVIGAAKMMDEIRRKYTDNPFNPAFQVAQITGRILAEIIIRTFPKRFVNVYGYSLGSEVIKEFLRRIIQQNQTHLLNNIYIMGGVSDSKQMVELTAQSQSPLSIYNCYTNNDAVLKHLLSLCKPDIKPVGLFQMSSVGGHNIKNMDCTKFISGHLAFRSNLGIMAKVLEVSIG